ncbi:MAG: trypsin-like peptidase domain-containing protein [Oligoflexia bacterium]|nr:trypsin-like peptidase domain-containing protein [Oligoflexia bacterium]
MDNKKNITYVSAGIVIGLILILMAVIFYRRYQDVMARRDTSLFRSQGAAAAAGGGIWSGSGPGAGSFNKLPAPAGEVPVEQQRQSALKEIIKSIRPCVVTVVSYQNEILQPSGNNYIKMLDPYKEGTKLTSSGIVIDKRGIILTTKDAITSAKIEVKFFRRKPNVFNAQILKLDNDLNLALLQVENLTDIFACPLGDSTTSQVGDIVYAIGSPYGFAETVTSGIISSNRQKVKIEGNLFKNLIQTDVIINKGNNGGPLVNIEGMVVGVNAAIYSENSTFSGIGFAIPINNIKRFIKGSLNGL